ncbi:hypothetical protein [Mammaliicoccus vitulinus]|uniref:hypothetical protein n=1 Tax=Mammaliicoccus vitulinus TaxID=71237 RepID=UPI00186637C6|nr:hypothetical protein [Mammaliicoccus vitulinus]
MNINDKKILKFIALKEFVYRNDINYIEDQLYEFIFETQLPESPEFQIFNIEWENDFNNLTLKDLLLKK